MEKKRLIELGEFLNKSVRDGSLKTNDAFAEGIILFTQESVALLKELEAVEPNEWIKCFDKMPEERESIFAKFKCTDKWSPAMFAQSSEDVRVVFVFADGTRTVSHSRTIDGKWECEKSPLKRTVTHWMPNPKLPTEDR